MKPAGPRQSGGDFASRTFAALDNVDAQLYDGFSADADRAAMKIVLETEPRNLPALDITFVDKRIEKLLFNCRRAQFSRYAG